MANWLPKPFRTQTSSPAHRAIAGSTRGLPVPLETVIWLHVLQPLPEKLLYVPDGVCVVAGLGGHYKVPPAQ